MATITIKNIKERRKKKIMYMTPEDEQQQFMVKRLNKE